MLNNPNEILKQLQQRFEQVKHHYHEFRLYDLGSYALNFLTPKSTYIAQKNIAYGLKARQRLDLYRAKKPLKQQPLIVFIHGGAWQHGDKKDYGFIGESFAREGYDVAVINYHLAPEYIFPSYIDDLALALNFLDQHQTKLKISTENVILMGHSAGAFNVMSVVYHPHPNLVHCRDNIKAIIGIAGPYHFDYKGDPLAQDAFDQEIPYQQVMPYYFVDSNQIRHYLLMAENDQIVAAKNTIDFDHILSQHGNHSHIAIIPKTGHISIIGTLSSLFSRYFKTKRTILSFLKESLET
ncbi:alpha/beta hydrolase [Acinetobacter ursingii]|uniref:alpha/beta hydrolase n=1 Tax=Acinetobacter ursingii TaxID=108980 RepID=UPI0021CDE4E4|nr:alpha/beta hydrolase [Acinetobacter ursingii]MCU4483679.1 alpha/beta hydrolase [Acinetobacter ursingii]MCU4507997.1 alpha/beta hydrolase [Acinetobacter ursingii]MCU4571023.1 alpha/beta hydrolase [Acinetobacter ursingii]